jgi:hypothetical protein
MKSIQTFLQEARSNPNLNPKIPIGSHLWMYAAKAKKIPGIGIVNAFVSFTEIDKLGINPQSTFNTPLGIYAYPIDFALDAAHTHMHFLPYAGDQPFVNLFQVKGNMIDLNHMTYSDLNKYVNEIKLAIAKEHRVKSGTEKFEEIDNIIDALVDEADSKAKNASYGGRFWYITKEATAYFAKYKNIQWQKKTIIKRDDNVIFKTKRYSIFWNKLFREIGIDAAFDNGAGIIHSNEPNQLVVFNPRSIKNKERHYNKYNPDDMYAGKNKSAQIEYIKKLSPFDIILNLFFTFEPNDLFREIIKTIPQSYSKEFIKALQKYSSDLNFSLLFEIISYHKNHKPFFINFTTQEVKDSIFLSPKLFEFFVAVKNKNMTFELVYDVYQNSKTWDAEEIKDTLKKYTMKWPIYLSELRKPKQDIPKELLKSIIE